MYKSTRAEKLANAICVCGTGRSGTTVFFNVLGTHPDLAWVSNLVERLPKYPELSILSRLHPVRVSLGPKSPIGRYIPRPAESLATLRRCSDGLFQVRRELSTNEIPESTISNVREFHERIVTWHGKRRLALKHTGFPRFQFWRAILPNPRFVHVIRDGRAVVYSMMRVSWWDGTMNSWWWGPMPDEYKEEYDRYGQSAIVLAAIVWKRLIDLFEAEAEKLKGESIIAVRYDSFVKAPAKELAKVAEFCELPFTGRFQEAVERFPIRNADVAWQKELSHSDLVKVEAVIGRHLEKYGFL